MSGPSLVRLVSEITMPGAFSSDLRPCRRFHARKQEARHTPPLYDENGKKPTLDLYLLKQISPLQIEHGPQFGRLLTSDATEQTADHAVRTCAQGARAMPRNRAVSALALEAGRRLILLRKSRTAVNRLLSRINAALTHLCPLSSLCKYYLTPAFDFSALLSPRGLWKQLSLHQSQLCFQTPPTLRPLYSFIFYCLSGNT